MMISRHVFIILNRQFVPSIPPRKVTTFPGTVTRYDPIRTTYLPIKPIMKDESTISHNIHILDNIYGDQFQLKDDDSMFTRDLRLIYGDLKTWKRIQAVKLLRRDTAEDPRDRFDWLLPGLGLWHLRYNMLQLIHKIHWGTNRHADPSTLQFAADRWGRSQVVQPNNFAALEDLVVHSYQARMVGVWIKILRIQKYPFTRIDETIPWLAAQSSISWGNVLNSIATRTQAPIPCSSYNMRPPQTDQEYENHQNFFVHVEAYFTLRYTIKHADIGLLRYALRRVTVIFQAQTSGTPHYAQALLHTLHMVDTLAATMKLQNAILANGLVNLRGENDSNFETDLLLELLNNNLRAFQHERTYFSKNNDSLLQD